MRRGASIIFLFLGGFCVGMQVMIGFMIGPGAARYAIRLAYFSVIAASFLAIGTWLSPGRRWRELGITILTGAAICVASFSIAIFLPDEHGVLMDRSQLSPYLTLVPGFVNLVLLTAAGLWLYLGEWGRKHVR